MTCIPPLSELQCRRPETQNASRPAPKWLDYDANNMVGKVVAMPARDDIDLPVEEHLIVELYSK